MPSLLGSSAQLSLFGPEEEAQLFHDPGRSGYFALLVDAQKDPTKKDIRQSSHLLSTMPSVLNSLDKSRDTWMSQAEFLSFNRRVVYLLRLGLLFADLDTYKMPWAGGRKPEQLADAVLHYCDEEGVPRPSLQVFSGRGIQAKWLLEGTIPRQALPRWNACQSYLVDRTAILGADPAAKDASRVLRLVHTVNTKSNEICRVVHVEERNGKPLRYDFEYLCEALLPLARRELEQQRQGEQRLKSIGGGRTSNLCSFSGPRLAWDRLEDLRRIARMRGGVPEGERMLHLFWRLNFLLLSGATNSRQMYHEARALAYELDPRWLHNSKELMTLYRKAKEYEAGERVEFNGKKYPPLYTPRNDTLITMFNITDAEQGQLQTIVSKDVAQERRRLRDQERDEERRRAAGAADRAAYLAGAVEKRTVARQLREQGLTVREIASSMGISKSAAGRYLG